MVDNSSSESVSRRNTLPKKFVSFFGSTSNKNVSKEKNVTKNTRNISDSSVLLSPKQVYGNLSSTTISRSSSSKSYKSQNHYQNQLSLQRPNNSTINTVENVKQNSLNHIGNSSTSSRKSSFSGVSITSPQQFSTLPSPNINNTNGNSHPKVQGLADKNLSVTSNLTSAEANNSHSANNLDLQSQTVPSTSSTTSLASGESFKRFVIGEDGSHFHSLKAARRQEKLRTMIKNILGSEKLRAQSKSAVPEIMMDTGNHVTADPPTLFSGLIKQVKDLKKTAGPDNEVGPISGAFYGAEKLMYKDKNPQNVRDDFFKSLKDKDGSLSFAEKYGRCSEVIGKGAFGTVRLCHKKDPKNPKIETFYAVKEFKRNSSEPFEKYSKRLISEFCISSSLRHTNIIEALDLFQDAKGDYSEVLEYCCGGDLYTLIIAAGKLEALESDCFFKQLIRGVSFMHEMGVCHRDLKPENLLLTSDGLLKITDFGNSECFKMAWETDIHLSEGVCGSSPYIAPEEYTQNEFDPRAVDMWACGVIYMAMRTGRQLWSTTQKDDIFYRQYIRNRKEKGSYGPIEALKKARCRNVIYAMLDPIPSRRITAKEFLNCEWGREIICCHKGQPLKWGSTFEFE